MFWLVDQFEHHLTQFIHLLRQNVRRMSARWNIRIAVVVAAQFTLQHIIGKSANQFPRIWRAKTHGIVHRIFQRVAFMRESWRNIKNIARLQLFIDDGFERIDL